MTQGRVIPDEPFHNFGALKSVELHRNRQSRDFEALKIGKGLVGYNKVYATRPTLLQFIKPQNPFDRRIQTTCRSYFEDKNCQKVRRVNRRLN